MLASLNSELTVSVDGPPRGYAAETNQAIVAHNLLFSYKKTEGLTLDICNFSVRKGEKVFLEGPSGSGKSTFLSLLAGVIAATSGEISLLGQNLAKMNGSKRDSFRADHIGVIFQMFNLLPYLSVIENTTLPCLFSKHRRNKVLNSGLLPEEEAVRILERLGLNSPAILTKRVTDLSVGQQQRVAAARALMGQPEIIIADEPTSSLDEANRGSFMDILFEECTRCGSSLIFASHDIALVPLFDKTEKLEEINRTGSQSLFEMTEMR